MELDYALSLATLLTDNHQTRPLLLDDWYEEFDPGFVNYYEYIKSPEWRVRANAAKRRAGYRCQTCGSNNKLQAHHLSYDRLGDEREEDIKVLCDECHEAVSKAHKKVNNYGDIPY
jgi:hypothetical protein